MEKTEFKFCERCRVPFYRYPEGERKYCSKECYILTLEEKALEEKEGKKNDKKE